MRMFVDLVKNWYKLEPVVFDRLTRKSRWGKSFLSSRNSKFGKRNKKVERLFNQCSCLRSSVMHGKWKSVVLSVLNGTIGSNVSSDDPLWNAFQYEVTNFNNHLVVGTYRIISERIIWRRSREWLYIPYCQHCMPLRRLVIGSDDDGAPYSANCRIRGAIIN